MKLSRIVKLVRLPKDADAQVEITVREMMAITVRSIYDPEVQWAIYHTRIGMVNESEAARAACEWVRENVDFQFDPEEVELLRLPSSVIKQIRSRHPVGQKPKGDCDDLALLLGTILLAQGIRVGYVTISTSLDNPNFRHIFVLAYCNGRWKPYDPSVSRPYRTEGLRRRDYYIPEHLTPAAI